MIAGTTTKEKSVVGQRKRKRKKQKKKMTMTKTTKAMPKLLWTHHSQLLGKKKTVMVVSELAESLATFCKLVCTMTDLTMQCKIGL